MGMGRASYASRAPAVVIGRQQIQELFPCILATAENNVEEQPCVVCLNDVQAGQSVRRLHCQHVFHVDCIDEWWTHIPRQVLQCPTCKQAQTEGSVGLSSHRTFQAETPMSQMPAAAQTADAAVPEMLVEVDNDE